MQSQFMAAINQLASEKNLPKDKVLEIVCHALRAAYRKDYGNREQNIEVVLDENTSQATVFVIKTVVETKKDIEEQEAQITLDDAKKYKKGVKVGDEIRIDVTPHDYGRIAAQSAKQVIIQRIQEAEKDIITDMYKDREHEILNGYINRVEGPTVYVDLERTQAILRPQDQIPRESYHNGQRIRVYLDKVVASPKGPRLLISRSHARLVNCLLEMEIPEVREGVVEIKAVAREPGVRTKVAVSSNDPNIDPIGACVGQKGVRIQNVMEEFNGERIDIIQWRESPKDMLRAALAPAKISYIDLDENRKRAAVYVPVEERALAIGKQGQNVRLASSLTGLEVDILDLDKLDPEKREKLQVVAQEEGTAPVVERKKKEKEPEQIMPVAAEDIRDLPGITEEVAKKLESAGFMKSIQLMGLNAEALMGIESITEKDAHVIESALKGEAPEKEKKEKRKPTKAKSTESPESAGPAEAPNSAKAPESIESPEAKQEKKPKKAKVKKEKDENTEDPREAKNESEVVE